MAWLRLELKAVHVARFEVSVERAWLHLQLKCKFWISHYQHGAFHLIPEESYRRSLSLRLLSLITFAVDPNLVAKVEIILPQFFSEVLDAVHLFQLSLFLKLFIEFSGKLTVEQLWSHLEKPIVVTDQERRSVLAANLGLVDLKHLEQSLDVLFLGLILYVHHDDLGLDWVSIADSVIDLLQLHLFHEPRLQGILAIVELKEDESIRVTSFQVSVFYLSSFLLFLTFVVQATQE